MLRDKIVESRFTSYLIETKDLGVIEIEAQKDLVGKTVEQVNVSGEFIVVAIRSLSGVLIPDPKTLVKEKDILMGVVKVASLDKIKEKFGIA